MIKSHFVNNCNKGPDNCKSFESEPNPYNWLEPWSLVTETNEN